MAETISSGRLESFRALIVYKKSHELALRVYKITRRFPPEEQFGLVAQMRRAAISIPSNIAEGYCRSSRKEYLNFLSIAFASGNELSAQLSIAHELEFIYDADYDKIQALESEVLKLLRRLIMSLKGPCLLNYHGLSSTNQSDGIRTHQSSEKAQQSHSFNRPPPIP